MQDFKLKLVQAVKIIIEINFEKLVPKTIFAYEIRMVKSKD